MSKELQTVETPIGALRITENELRRGKLSLVRRTFPLQRGEDYTEIQGKALLSPAGADKINTICGLQVVELVGPNYREDKKDDNGYTSCTRSVIVAGYSPTGRPVVVGPVTMTFSPGAYLLHALGKMAGTKGPVRVAAVGSPAPEPEGWVFFPVDAITGLWCNLGNSDVLKHYTTYLQDRKFADRRCMGILRRNALSQHPGGPPKYVQGGQVSVAAWIPDLEQDLRTQEQELRRAAESDDPRRVIDADFMDAEPQDLRELEEELSGERDPEDETDAGNDPWFGQDK